MNLPSGTMHRVLRLRPDEREGREPPALSLSTPYVSGPTPKRSPRRWAPPAQFPCAPVTAERHDKESFVLFEKYREF